MGWANSYATRDTVLGTDLTITGTESADYKTSWDNLLNDLGLVQLDEDGQIPIDLIPPGALGGDGTGDVVGPSGVTANLVALFNGSSGKVIKAGSAAQTLPTAGTEGYFLGFESGVPVWLENSQSIADASIALEKIINITGGSIMGRKAADGSGPMQMLTPGEAAAEIGVEPGATGDMTGEEIIAALVGATTEDPTFASDFAHMALAAIASYVANDPSAAHADMTASGMVWTQGLINAAQAVVGAADDTTSVAAVDMTNGTPTVAGIVAGSIGMIATSEIMASTWAPRQATLASGALSFDASTGLQWTVAAGANNITVAESCWTNLPLDKAARLEVVQGGTGRTITFANTSANLVVDTTSSPWSTANKRMAFELSWLVEGAAPTIKSKRLVVFLGSSS